MSFLSGPNDYAYLDWFQCKSQSESYGLYGNPSLNNSDMAAYQYSAGGSAGRAGWKEWSAFGVDALTPSLSVGAPWPDIYDTTGSPMPVPLKHYQVRVSPVKGWGGQGIPTQAPAEPNPEIPLLLDFNSLDLYTYNRTVPLEWDTIDGVWKFAENYVGSGTFTEFNSAWGSGITGWEKGAGKWLIAGAPVKPFGDPMPLGGAQMDQNANYRAAATFNGAEKDIDLADHWSGMGCTGSKKIKFLGGYPQTERDYTYWGKEDAADYGDDAPSEAQGSQGIPLAEAVRPIKGAPLRLQKIPLCIDSKHPLFNCICDSASQDHESNTGKDRSISGYFYTLATDPVLYFNDSIGPDGETMQWIGEEGVLPLNATCGSETVSGGSGGCGDVFNQVGITGIYATGAGFTGLSGGISIMASGCDNGLFFKGCSGIDLNINTGISGISIIEICYTGLTGAAATGSGCSDVFNKFGVPGSTVVASGCSNTLLFSGCSGIDLNLNTGGATPVVEICYTGITGSITTSGCENVFRTVYDQSNTPHTASGCDDSFSIVGSGSVNTVWDGDSLVIDNPVPPGTGQIIFNSGDTYNEYYYSSTGLYYDYIDPHFHVYGNSTIHNDLRVGGNLIGNNGAPFCQNSWGRITTDGESILAEGCDDLLILSGSGGLNTSLGDEGQVVFSSNGTFCENSWGRITTNTESIEAVGCNDHLILSGSGGLNTTVDDNGQVVFSYTGTGAGGFMQIYDQDSNSLEASENNWFFLKGSGGIDVEYDPNPGPWPAGPTFWIKYTGDAGGGGGTARECVTYLTYTGAPGVAPGSAVGFVNDTSKLILSGLDSSEGGQYSWNSGDLACISMKNTDGTLVSVPATLTNILPNLTSNPSLWPFGAGSTGYAFSGMGQTEGDYSGWNQFFNQGQAGLYNYTGINALSMEICKGVCPDTGCDDAFSQVSAGGQVLSASGCDTLTITGEEGIKVSVEDDALQIEYTGEVGCTAAWSVLHAPASQTDDGSDSYLVINGCGNHLTVSGESGIAANIKEGALAIAYTGTGAGGSASGCENAFSQISSDDGTLEATSCDSLGISGISGIQTKVEGGALWVGYTGETGGGGGGGSPGGSNTYVQYNDNGSFGGSSTFTWTHSTATLNATNVRATDITGLTISGGTIYGDEASFGTSLKISGQDVATGSVCRESWNKIWAQHRFSIPSLDATGCGDEVVIKGSGGIEILADDTPYDGISNPDGPSILHVKYTGLQGYEKKLITLCEDGVLSSGWVLFKPFE